MGCLSKIVNCSDWFRVNIIKSLQDWLEKEMLLENYPYNLNCSFWDYFSAKTKLAKYVWNLLDVIPNVWVL